MKRLKLSYKDSLVSETELKKTLKRLEPELQQMNKVAEMSEAAEAAEAAEATETAETAESSSYEDDRSSINLPFDKMSLAAAAQLIKLKQRQLNPEYLVVIGIGGSNLGTIAVQEAVLGKLYNQHCPKTKILYADTVDSDSLHDIILIIEPVLKSGRNIILNVVSKSGTTLETIANFKVLLALLKKYKGDCAEYVVVTTGKGSKLWRVAESMGFDVLAVPKKVEGRYSVFSAVGLFPLGMLGVNIGRMLKGAAEMRKCCLKYCLSLEDNPAAISAALLYHHYKAGRNIADLFLFSNDLESVGKWYRQLMAESIGKESDLNGKEINAGITPTVSIGSTDLHSMAQLYLAGPDDKYITFVGLADCNSAVKVPDAGLGLTAGIRGKGLCSIMNAILCGVQAAFRQGKRPFSVVELPDKSEYSIAAFLQFKMIEVMYLAALLNVNPFDQPAVEKYKAETRKILARNRGR